jgi:HEPN domain-containing protein
MKQTTLNWFRSAENDLQTAESLLRSRRYIYVLFMCHLTVKKFLKAIVAESSTVFPPRTHNLYRLLELGHITLPAVYQDLVAKLNAMSVVTRYPEEITTFGPAWLDCGPTRGAEPCALGW